MATDWLVYWRKEQILRSLSDRLLVHAASEQFGSVHPGDTLWISGQSGSDLVTVGPLEVLELVSQEEAERRLPYKPWQSEYHAMAAQGKATAAKEVSLAPLLEELRFLSDRNPQLDLGKPLGQQLQSIRRLTPASAKRLRQLWDTKVSEFTHGFDAVQSKLDALETLDEQVTATRRKEQGFLREHLFGNGDMGTCAICGEEMPVTLLVAAHIKPRAKCTDAEKRDYTNNVVPMCMLGCDALFERGLISIRYGKVAVHLGRTVTERVRRFCKDLDGCASSSWRAGRIPYFRWHAQYRRDLLQKGLIDA
jgi:hypothetical protein